MSFGNQLCIEARIVIQLAIEDDYDRPVFVGERLVPAGKVDDAQAAHPQPEPIFDEGAPIVGSPVSDGVAHPKNLRL
jgi:hypothetical protein